MKTMLALLALLVATASQAAAQGTFIFINSSATAITNALTQARATGLKVGAYYSPNTDLVRTQHSPSLLPVSNAVTNLFAPGLFVGGIRSIAGTGAGSYVAMQIRVWSEAYASYEDALFSGDPAVEISLSRVFLVGPLGEGPTPPAPIIGLNRLTPIVISHIPEPPTYALGLLGAAILFCWRRRKN